MILFAAGVLAAASLLIVGTALSMPRD